MYLPLPAACFSCLCLIPEPPSQAMSRVDCWERRGWGGMIPKSSTGRGPPGCRGVGGIAIDQDFPVPSSWMPEVWLHFDSILGSKVHFSSCSVCSFHSVLFFMSLTQKTLSQAVCCWALSLPFFLEFSNTALIPLGRECSLCIHVKYVVFTMLSIKARLW